MLYMLHRVISESFPQAVILQYKYSEDIEELVDGIRSGFAQRDAENAKLQYEAFCKAVGFNPLEANIEVIEQNQKKRSRKQKPSASDALTQLDSVNDDMSIDDIIFLNGVCRHEQSDGSLKLNVLFLNGVCRHEPSNLLP